MGGGQVYVQKLVAELARRNHDVTVVATMPWTHESGSFHLRWSTWNGIRVAGVAINPEAISAGERWTERPKPLVDALSQVAAEVQPEVIHLNGLKPALVTVALGQSIPHVVTAHHAGVACPSGALLQPDDSLCSRSLDEAACAACYCRQLRGGTRAGKILSRTPKAVYRPLGRALNLLPNPTYAGRVMMYPWLVGRGVDGKQHALRMAQRWIAPSRAIAKLLIRNGTPTKKVSVVPHGIEPLQRTPIEPLGRRPVRVGYVGRINRIKGLHLLFQAFAQLPEGAAELHIIGGAQRNDEQAYFANAIAVCGGRADVKLHGSTPHEQLGALIRHLDVLVLPTICLEVFGLVILEAFSVGRPVIVSDCGGPAEIVRHGIDGLVVNRNDASALASAMRALIDRPERITEMAANIRPVRTLAEHVSEVESVYEDVVASGRVAPVPL